MLSAASQERVEHFLQSRREYLESVERQWADIHEGPISETGLKRLCGRETKEVCEDTKLKNRQKGLFVVADGVSTSMDEPRKRGNGWFASRESARVMYEQLGESLDQEIENTMVAAIEGGKDPVELVSKLVTSNMTAAVLMANQRIVAASLNPEFADSATTLSCGKLLELPDGKGTTIHRFFFTNVGDSRIHLSHRGKRLHKLTKDDTWLQLLVKRGRISQADHDEIDQAADRTRVPSHLFHYANHQLRSSITRSIGAGEQGIGTVDVYYLDLEPGDRILMTSDGVSDQMRETRIQQLLDGEEDDTKVEELLQGTALRMSIDGTDPRAKPDDISALVHTVEEQGPNRSYLYPESREPESPESLQERIVRCTQSLQAARNETMRLERELANLAPLTLMRERLATVVSLDEAREREHQYAYHVQRAKLDLVDREIVPRFDVADCVALWREDFDPPGFDPHRWRVSGYDPTSKTYRLVGSGGTHLDLSRYVLESDQFEIQESVRDRLNAAERIRQRMEQALEGYHCARGATGEHRQDLLRVEEMEARQRDIDWARRQD